MAYNRNIPASTDLISNSQPQIQANFQAIDSGVTGTGVGFSRNHITITDATNGGLHNRVDFYQNLSDPTVSGFVSSVYPKSISAASELCFSNSTGVLTQITSGALPIWKGGTTGTSGVVTSTNGSSGALNLPNGIQFRWGSQSVNTGGTPIAYSSRFTTGSYSVTLTPQTSTSRGAAVNSVTADGFNAFSENNGTLMYYFAVGH